MYMQYMYLQYIIFSCDVDLLGKQIFDPPAELW